MKSKLAKRTPGPWNIDDNGDQNQYYIESAEGIYIGSIQALNDELTAQEADEESHANACFIVKACNSHDALVSAIEGMLEWARRVGGRNPGPEILNAHNALKLAGEDV